MGHRSPTRSRPPPPAIEAKNPYPSAPHRSNPAVLQQGPTHRATPRRHPRTQAAEPAAVPRLTAKPGPPTTWAQEAATRQPKPPAATRETSHGQYAPKMPNPVVLDRVPDQAMSQMRSATARRWKRPVWTRETMRRRSAVEKARHRLAHRLCRGCAWSRPRGRLPRKVLGRQRSSSRRHRFRGRRVTWSRRLPMRRRHVVVPRVMYSRHHPAPRGRDRRTCCPRLPRKVLVRSRTSFCRRFRCGHGGVGWRGGGRRLGCRRSGRLPRWSVGGFRESGRVRRRRRVRVSPVSRCGRCARGAPGDSRRPTVRRSGRAHAHPVARARPVRAEPGNRSHDPDARATAAEAPERSGTPCSQAPPAEPLARQGYPPSARSRSSGRLSRRPWHANHPLHRHVGAHPARSHGRHLTANGRHVRSVPRRYIALRNAPATLVRAGPTCRDHGRCATRRRVTTTRPVAKTGPRTRPK